MARKPKPRLLLRAPVALFANGENGVISSRNVTSHLPRLEVDWRLYKVQINNGYGAFGNTVRWLVEGSDNTNELRKVA